MNKDVVLYGKTYTFCDFTGQLMDISKQRETHISGSGGGGATWDGYGVTEPINIQSSTTLHEDLYLMNKDGQEKHFKMQNWDIAGRTGHKMQVVWVIAPTRQSGPYVAVYNHDLNTTNWADNQIQKLAAAHYAFQKWGSFLVVAVVGYVMGSFWVFLIGVVMVWLYWAAKQQHLVREIKNTVVQILNQLD